jgi:hypothetical protein
MGTVDTFTRSAEGASCAPDVIPGSRRLARLLGALMITDGLALLGASLLGGMAPQLKPM